tara:strand:- start:11647 stop:12576 length:930 start_codon:yes stop_codon:yes gene_type:complete
MVNELLEVLLIAVILDRVFGEPSNTFHPIAYLGKIIGFFMKRFSNNKFHGILIYFIVVVPVVTLIFVISNIGSFPLNLLFGSVVLKLQLSWRGLWDHARPVVDLLNIGDLEAARKEVVSLVGRETSSLNNKHVVSATVESIGESIVDGILAPLFYFTIFGLAFGLPYGLAAATLYRVTNTLDSMVGYKKQGINHLGFFSARMDDVLNYIPARIGAVLLIVSSLFLRENWKNAITVYQRDKCKTQSPNSGHTIAVVAGALDVELEKIGFYRIGENKESIKVRHIYRAMRLVNLSTTLAILLISLLLWMVG